MKKRDYLFGFGDLETCYDIAKIKQIEKQSKVKMSDYLRVSSRVYLTGYTFGFTYKECEENFKQSAKIDSFYEFISTYLTKDFKLPSHRKMHFYFHNLNFDISFMLDNLIKLYKDYDIKILGSLNKIVQLSIRNKDTGNQFILLDSLNIMRMKLSEFPVIDGIAKQTEVDMSILRDIDHIATAKEKTHNKYDVLTLAKGILNHFDDKYMHISNGSYAYRMFQNELKKYNLMKYFNLDRYGYMQDYNISRLNKYNFKRFIGNMLSERDTTLNLEDYYMGAQTFINHRYQAKVLDNAIVIDNNGLYAYAYLNCKIPYITNHNSKIKPEYTRLNLTKEVKFDNPMEVYDKIAEREELTTDDIKKNYFVTFKMIMDIELKDDLTFSPITNGSCAEVINIEEFVDEKVRTLKKARVVFRGSEYDLHNWLKYYNISNLMLIEYFIFDVMKGYDLKKMRNIILKWIKDKESHSNDDNLTTYYGIKQLINSVTGKFGEKMGRKEVKLIDGELIEVENEAIKTRLLPLIISITSFSRAYMSSFITKEKNNFVYSDTDSITLVNLTLEELYSKYKISKKTTGLFKIEKIFDKAIYSKPKIYVGLTDNQLKFTCAGAQIDEEKIKNIDIEDLLNGNIVVGRKTLNVACKNGTFIRNSPFIFKLDSGRSNNILCYKNKTDETYINRYLFNDYDGKMRKLNQILDQLEHDPEIDNKFTINNEKDSMYSSIIKERDYEDRIH